MSTQPSTRVTRHIRAPRALVYRALLDARRIAEWKVPDNMTAQVHEFDAHEGGRIRISLTYDAPDQRGKSSAHSDTYHGRFEKLVPNEQIIEVDEFESADPSLRGDMRITISLADFKGGTDLVAIHEGLPLAVAPEDNEAGWRMSLAKLAAMVEAEARQS